MLGRIVYMSNTYAQVELSGAAPIKNMMNLHIVFEDGQRKILGEVDDIDTKMIKVHFLGEIVGDKFMTGFVMKPSLDSSIRLISSDELKTIVGVNDQNNIYLGRSPLYENCPIYVNINDLFSNHMAIFGNTGSGKSYGVAKVLQNIFSNPALVPIHSNFFIFDSYGEYHNAFSSIGEKNPEFNFKYYTTNLSDNAGSVLRIPVWLLNVDDVALLLNASSHSQLQIIDRMLKLANIFSESSDNARKYKNHLIAKAIMSILYTNQPATSKKNDIYTIISNCSTPEFNMNSPVEGVGFVRKFRDCFAINKDGEFSEEIIITEYITGFINEELEMVEPSRTNKYSLKDMEKALEFTLISEGLLRNEKMYGEAITLKVRLHSLIISQNSIFFDFPSYVGLENYISSLVFCENGKKAQIVNFNLEDIDDSLAKVITKIYTRLLFEFTKKLKYRASVPFHIFLEEAHRYVQNDTDNYLLGYNIFERVAKEGRKYGLMLNLISQRPIEISETVISQCTNFMIFRLNHPKDLGYIKGMLPNINAEIVEKQKTLQPGSCVAFGRAFKVPLIISMELPNPEPHSSNCDVINRWK